MHLTVQIGKSRTDDPVEETKQKAFMSQLNKLTPDNFEKICGKILEVGIEQPKTLRSLIDQVQTIDIYGSHILGSCLITCTFHCVRRRLFSHLPPFLSPLNLFTFELLIRCTS